MCVCVQAAEELKCMTVMCVENCGRWSEGHCLIQTAAAALCTSHCSCFTGKIYPKAQLPIRSLYVISCFKAKDQTPLPHTELGLLGFSSCWRWKAAGSEAETQAAGFRPSSVGLRQILLQGLEMNRCSWKRFPEILSPFVTDVAPPLGLNVWRSQSEERKEMFLTTFISNTSAVTFQGSELWSHSAFVRLNPLSAPQTRHW